MVDRSAHWGDWAAWPEDHLGPALVDVVLGPLLLEFHDFHNQIPSCCRGVLPHTCFLFSFMHNMWRQTHIQKK